MGVLPREGPPDASTSPLLGVGELLGVDLQADGEGHAEGHAEENVGYARVHVVGEDVADDEGGFDCFEAGVGEEVGHAEGLV